MKNILKISTLCLFALSTFFFVACNSSANLVQGQKLNKEEKNIVKVVNDVTAAINSQDKKAMKLNYSTVDRVLPITSSEEVRVMGNTDQYIDKLWEAFDGLESVKNVLNDDIKVQVFDNVATVSVTGTTDAINNLGQTGTNKWLWSLQMEKVDGDWKIRNENVNIFAENDASLAGNVEGDAKCLASVSVKVEMNDIGLAMQTKFPVDWHSEVTSIPPVDYTASVALTPTPLVSKNREVGTLIHGAVKFREVVKQVPMTGTEG